MTLLGLKNRVQRASLFAGDRMSAAATGSWVSPPEQACLRIVSQLGICEATSGEIDNLPVAFLTLFSGITFAGPNDPDKWTCSARRVHQLRKKLVGTRVHRDVHLSDAHVALLHNIIVRYVTEFSSYPYHPYRTQNVFSGDTFLDIGAFRGYTSVKASLKVGPSGHVYSVEPIDENMRFVRAHCEMNGIRNVSYIQGAVTTDSGPEARIYRTDNQANSCIPTHLKGSRTSVSVENISATTLSRTVMSTSPRRVIASITTNGTERELAGQLVEQFAETDLDRLELTLPIIYSRSDLPSFLSAMDSRVTAIEVNYPWLKLVCRW